MSGNAEATPPADTPNPSPDLRGWGTEFRWKVEGAPEEGFTCEASRDRQANTNKGNAERNKSATPDPTLKAARLVQARVRALRFERLREKLADASTLQRTSATMAWHVEGHPLDAAVGIQGHVGKCAVCGHKEIHIVRLETDTPCDQCDATCIRCLRPAAVAHREALERYFKVILNEMPFGQYRQVDFAKLTSRKLAAYLDIENWQMTFGDDEIRISRPG